MPILETCKEIWGCSQVRSYLGAPETNSIDSLTAASGFVMSPGFLTRDLEPTEFKKVSTWVTVFEWIVSRECHSLSYFKKGRDSALRASKCYWNIFWTYNTLLINAACFIIKEKEEWSAKNIYEKMRSGLQESVEDGVQRWIGIILENTANK